MSAGKDLERSVKRIAVGGICLLPVDQHPHNRNRSSRIRGGDQHRRPIHGGTIARREHSNATRRGLDRNLLHRDRRSAGCVKRRSGDEICAHDGIGMGGGRRIDHGTVSKIDHRPGRISP